MKKWFKKVNVKKWLIASIITLGLLGLIGGAAYQYDKVWSYEMMADEVEELLPGVEVGRIEIVDANVDSETPVYYMSIDLFVYDEWENEETYYNIGVILMWIGFWQGPGEEELLSQAIVPLIAKYFPHRQNDIYIVAINVCLPDRVTEGNEDLVIFQITYTRISKVDFIKEGDVLMFPILISLSQMYPDYYGEE